jgi:hypothetical protein
MKRILLIVTALALVVAPAVAAGGGLLVGTYKNGAVTLQVKGNGDYIVKQGGSLAVKGTANVQGQRIDFNDKSGPNTCKGAKAKAIYTWGGDPKQFVLFQAVTEPCAARKAVLGSGVWKRSG